MRVLAIDVGSSSVKAAYWDGERFRSRVRVGYATKFDGVRAELDAGTVMRAVEKAGKEAEAGQAEVVAFCALSSGVVVMDEKGKVRFGVVTHQDRRSVEEAKHLEERVGAGWLVKQTGNLPYPGGIGSSTLAWVSKHERGALRGKYRVGQLSSLLGYLLTGEWKIDPSQAVFLGLWDIPAWRWSERMCRAVGVRMESLPECVWADESMGVLNGRMARMWGIREGTPVVGGFVDTSAAVLQTPMRAGQLTHNCGSTDVLAMCVKEPQRMEGVLTRPVGVRGKRGEAEWLTVLTIAASGSALAWARREFFADMRDAAWNKLMLKACAASTPKTLYDDAHVACIPDFSGRRAAIEQGKGAAFLGLRLATTKEEMLTAIVRGLVRQSAFHYKVLSGIHPPAREVFCMGSVKDVAKRMHDAWGVKHLFRELPGDSMAGLVELARRAVGE